MLSFCSSVLVLALSGHPKPSHTNLAETARWLMHEVTWGVLTTTSVQEGLEGAPFGNPQSLVDGPYDAHYHGSNNGTGVPYFYVSEMDVSQVDVTVNATASLTVSEAQLPNGCAKTDPEDPTCVRVTLTGEVVEVTEDGEREWALAALFQRHPVMKDWPTDHDWVVKKLVPRHVFILDFYGGAKPLSVDDYLAVKAA